MTRNLFKNLSNDPYGNSSSLNYKRYGFRANADFFLTKTSSSPSTSAHASRSVAVPTPTRETTSATSSISSTTLQAGYSPIAYQVQNGDEMKTLYGGSSQYQSNVYATLAEGGYYKAVNTVNETNFIADYKMDWLSPGPPPAQ